MATTDVVSWPRPVPLDAYSLLPFPVHLLPEWLGRYVTALAEDTQTPVDLAGMLAFAVLATCCAKRAVLHVRPGWWEPLSLWAIVGLGSGSRKTPVLGRMTEPLETYEREWLSKAGPALAVERSKRRSLEMRLQTLEKEIAKDGGAADPGVLEERNRLAEELEKPPVHGVPRVFVEDITPERLASKLAEQGGRIALFSDEGGPLDIMAGRYAKNRIPNFDVFLKADSGSDIRVDRRGRSSEFVHAPALTMALAVQPDVIRNLGGQPGFAGRGLLSRPLYSLPRDTVGSRKVESAPVPAFVESAYSAAVLRLLAGAEHVQREDFAPSTLKLSTHALRVLNELSASIEPKLAPHGELGAIQGWSGKLVGKVARIAALFHLADLGEVCEGRSDEVDPFAVERAVKVAPYLIEHAKAAFGEMGADPVKRDARIVLDWIWAHGRSSLSKRDAFNALRGRFERADKLDAPLRLLEDLDYLRAEHQEPREGAGRPPSPVFHINPHFLTQNPHNRQNGSAHSADSARRPPKASGGPRD